MRLHPACLVLVATLVQGSWVDAQQPERIVLDAVEIQGLERVSEQLVRSQLEVQEGLSFNPLAVSRDIRRLYELGFFTTIRADLDPVSKILLYIFEEERFVQEVLIIGNKKVKDRLVRGVLRWREGDSFFKEGYAEERDALLELYRSKGFLNTAVDIVAEEVAPSRMRITYVIDEGSKARIKKIRLEGIQALSERELKKIIKTKRAYWFFGGKYDEEKFEADLFNVIESYADVGRLEAEIASTEFEYKRKGKRIAIVIRLNEGAEYRLESIEVANNRVFADHELGEDIHIAAGEVHNKSQINEDAQTLQDRYLDNGYVNARVVPQVTLDRVKKTTDVTHQVQERSLKYIREIDITGNAVTKDEIIRRQILLQPGERFDGTEYRNSQRRLEATEYFEGTRLRLEDEEDNDRFTNLLVDVDEGKTGNFSFGGAFNTDEGVAGFGELSLNNFDITNWPSFSGGGQQLFTRFSIGSVRTNLRVSFTDPEILGYPISFGVDLFDERFRSTGATSFTQETLGGQLRFGKALSTFNSVNAVFRYTDVEITNLDTFVNPALRELQDPGTTAGAIFGFSRNTANHFRDPTAGGRHDLAMDVAGFIGDSDFVKFTHDSIWYYGLKNLKKLSFSFRTREGYGFTYGDKDLLPLQERFFAGGSSTIRGYDFRDVGPKAKTFRVLGNGQVFVNEEAIGGHFRVLNSVEAKYKLNDLLRLYTFFDAGGVWLEPEDFDFSDYRYSVGVGVGIQVPFLGPLRVDYGFPLNPDGSQGSGRLDLQSSLRF